MSRASKVFDPDFESRLDTAFENLRTARENFADSVHLLQLRMHELDRLLELLKSKEVRDL